ncbi:MAG TPA: hypothetical protein VLT90_13050 [Terriglobales bacterium]|nr:hypothetical protein [Terriglobales bacterium]
MTIPPIAGDSLDSQLARASNYIVNYWWPTKRGYPTSGIPALTWTVVSGNPGTTAYNQELAVRGAAMNAFTLAVPLFTGSYNEWSVSIGTPSMVQRLYAAKLIVMCARQHLAATTPLSGAQTWGHSWQSPLWAAYVGLAALCGWYDLIPNTVDRNNVLAMIESECEYVLGLNTDFWQVPSGTGYVDGPNTLNPNDGPTRSGNSAAEELSWNAAVLWVGSALMPLHPHAETWKTKAVELNVCAFSSPFDLNSSTMVYGQTVSAWIAGRGYNVDSLDRVTNHQRIHPDYMTTITQNLFGWVARAISGLTTPVGVAWNFNFVYRALQVSALDLSGTTAYDPSTARIKFPDTTPTSDWGSRRPAAYACFDGLNMLFVDVFDSLLDQDGRTGTIWPAAYWLALHSGDSSNMQLRATSATHAYGAFVDTSVSPAEATYPEEEAYAASQLAFLRLAQYLKYNRPDLWED